MKKIIGGLMLMAMLSSVSIAETNKALWENLKRLKDGQNIKVVQLNSSVTEGKFYEVSPEEISVEVKKKLIVIKRTDVQRVEIKKSRLLHTLIGAGIGAGVGLVAIGGSNGDGVYGAYVALPILAGGAAGVGAALPTKAVAYERP